MIRSKILRVADVVKAMASDRPYRSALSMAETLKPIIENKEKLDDSAVVDACLKVVGRPNFKFE